MSKPNLDFLASLQLEEVMGSQSFAPVKVVRNPKNADLRLFKDGSIYPSLALIDEFNLQYKNKDSQEAEFGFDVFPSTHWGMWPEQANNLMLIASVSKHASKVDVFAKCAYDDNGDPKADVAKQGASSFGKRLIEMLQEVYEVELFAEGRNFIDLTINKSTPLAPTTNQVYNIPKKIVKGDKAGEWSYIRRENITIYPLLIDEDSMKVSAESSDPAVDEIASLAGDIETAVPDAQEKTSGEKPLVLEDEAADLLNMKEDEQNHTN